MTISLFQPKTDRVGWHHHILRQATSSSRSTKFFSIVIVVLILFFWSFVPGFGLVTETSLWQQPLDQKVYDLIPGRPGETAPTFEFLDQVDPSLYLRPSVYLTIDQAHRQGRYHAGAWILVVDATGRKILLLRRGPQLVTCPNAWGLVGEHALKDESPLETVQRAMVEELWGGQNHTENTVAFIQNLTVHPVLYLRHYGPEKDNRIDRQLTYLFEVRLKQLSQDINFMLDDEVADHQWIDVDDFIAWLERDAATNQNRDFCHSTITELSLHAVKKLSILHGQENPK